MPQQQQQHRRVHDCSLSVAAPTTFLYLIQETKLTSKDSMPAFPGFSAIHQDRPVSHRGGGLFTLVKEVILYKRITEVYQPPMEKQSIQI